MFNKLVFLMLLIGNIGFSQLQLPLIPQPKVINLDGGSFMFHNTTVIQANENSFEAKYLHEVILLQTGLDLKIASHSNAVSKLILNVTTPDFVNFNKESYSLIISKNEININANANQGLFYGVQTLVQLIPFKITKEVKLPCLQIEDEPKYAWRGMHLDVSRHFFPVDFVKKYIDYLTMYKMNTFHWHLTDDQGWRIEIKQYPKLTEVGAWRKGSMVGHYREQKFDYTRYGGFYTQEEIKEVVVYATERHITVVPEIEMPGHAVAALASYPEYSCTGGPFEVALKWGVLDDVFCPKEGTFKFLENILTEVIGLFPSEYIHIGGDECPKTRWKKCSNCQALIQKEGLKDEHELQSYFIQRIEKFVNSKGRKIIGWDEILEGGLAPNAAVMSWRGIKGGIDAAKQKHFVVMTPSSYCYFDHYQGEPKNEPLAIGGYTAVEKVYSFNPTPKELSADEAKYILGAQGNVWTEYMEDSQKVEYMIFPRMMALSEVLWGTSNPGNYKDFQDRMILHFPTFDKKYINYSKSLFEITTSVAPSEDSKGVTFSLNSTRNPNGIRFTLDGTLPNLNSSKYINPILITKNQTVKAAYFEDQKQINGMVEQAFYINKATGKSLTLVNPPSESYAAGGTFTLVDGIMGNRDKFGRDWLGFSGKDLIATVDLSKQEQINKVTVGFLASEGSWIYFPKSIAVFISDDGINFKNVSLITKEEIVAVNGSVTIKLGAEKAQYIKVIAENSGKIPEGFAGAGSKSWLFVDEIGIE
ncbi:family 20 glycosylhydrolase [uncultured Flavobacterium sp.]|uniref:glycoside hydrolase family 20 protein n=1 Tax=uncultured Flavobacterium sp. TaxID=165435 RepID=UPI0030CA3D15